MKEKFFNISMLWFLLIGAGNTILTMLMMFGMYNRLHLGYWVSSSIAFFICSLISFVLNKRISFKNQDSVMKTAIRFAIVIIICYISAYSIAKPITAKALNYMNFNVSYVTVEKVALVTGQVVFTSLNYLGQRFFAFKSSN